MHKSLLLLVGLLSNSLPTSALDFYVATEGSDQANGRFRQVEASGKDGPFRTLQRAQQAIRDLKKTGNFKEAVTVHIAAGDYHLKQPLEFDIRDSGFPDRSITWQGEPGAMPVISGGKVLECKPGNPLAQLECPISFDLPKSNNFTPNRISGDVPVFALFADDRKLSLARWPNGDWAHIKVPLNASTEFSVIEPLPIFPEGLSGAQIHLFPGNDWFDQYLGVTAVDSTRNSIRLASPTQFPLASGRQFYLQNIASALDAPGEWIYEAAVSKITLIAPDGPAPTKIVLAGLPSLFNLKGASQLTFKNLSLQHSVNAAITGSGLHDVVFDRLSLSNVEGKAIDISGNHLALSNSEVHHTGAGGAYLSGGDRAKLTPADNKIVNNHFHHIASTLLTATPAVQISGVATMVAHNLIEQTANAGIVIYGNNHLVEKNELHHQCLDCADCGAIYASGDWSIRGNRIRYNYVHDVIGYGLESVDLAANRVIFKSPKEGRGIYIDDGASGFEILGNILSNPGYIGIQINGGRDNEIRGNFINAGNSAIWILNRERYINWGRLQARLAESAYQSPEWRNAYPALAVPMHRPQWPEGNRVHRNIMVSDNPGSDSVFLRYDIPAQSTALSENIVWSNTGIVKVRNELLGDQASRISSWSEWMSIGVEKSSLNVDPCAGITNKSLILCPASPAKDIKFEPIPNDIGLSGH